MSHEANIAKTSTETVQPGNKWSLRRRIGLLGGPLLFTLMLSLPRPTDMPATAWPMAAIALLMAVWWITEAIPIPATSLLPRVTALCAP